MKNVLKTIMSLASTKNICLHIFLKNSYTAHSSYFIRDIIPYFCSRISNRFFVNFCPREG